MKKDIFKIFIPIIGVMVAEFLMFFGKDFIFYGLLLHMFNLIAIITIIIFSSIELEKKNVLQSITLIILLRIANLSMPKLFTIDILQYPMMYGVMFIPIYYVIKNQHISSKELGIDFRNFHIYLPVAIIIGTLMAIIEYKILDPTSLIKDIKISNVILITIVMSLFVGLVEEIIFRSIFQTRIEKMFGASIFGTKGPSYGTITTGFTFGIMHASYGIMAEIAFAIIFGIILGYIFQKTKSLPFVASIHGVADIMTFGILSKIVFMI